MHKLLPQPSKRLLYKKPSQNVIEQILKRAYGIQAKIKINLHYNDLIREQTLPMPLILNNHEETIENLHGLDATEEGIWVPEVRMRERTENTQLQDLKLFTTSDNKVWGVLQNRTCATLILWDLNERSVIPKQKEKNNTIKKIQKIGEEILIQYLKEGVLTGLRYPQKALKLERITKENEPETKENLQLLSKKYILKINIPTETIRPPQKIEYLQITLTNLETGESINGEIPSNTRRLKVICGSLTYIETNEEGFFFCIQKKERIETEIKTISHLKKLKEGRTTAEILLITEKGMLEVKVEKKENWEIKITKSFKRLFGIISKSSIKAEYVLLEEKLSKNATLYNKKTNEFIQIFPHSKILEVKFLNKNNLIGIRKRTTEREEKFEIFIYNIQTKEITILKESRNNLSQAKKIKKNRIVFKENTEVKIAYLGHKKEDAKEEEKKESKKRKLG